MAGQLPTLPIHLLRTCNVSFYFPLDIYFLFEYSIVKNWDASIVDSKYKRYKICIFFQRQLQQ